MHVGVAQFLVIRRLCAYEKHRHIDVGCRDWMDFHGDAVPGQPVSHRAASAAKIGTETQARRKHKYWDFSVQASDFYSLLRLIRGSCLCECVSAQLSFSNDSAIYDFSAVVISFARHLGQAVQEQA